jgi:hypothetical protein
VGTEGRGNHHGKDNEGREEAQAHEGCVWMGNVGMTSSWWIKPLTVCQWISNDFGQVIRGMNTDACLDNRTAIVPVSQMGCR